MVLSGADIIVKVLIEQGCNTVFGYPGGQILNVYDSLYKYQNEITHILTAHEQGATHAADGYARTTGKVGVVISTSGPGATNLVTGIATAYLDSVPLVAICGNVPTSQIGTDSFQEINITEVTKPITKKNFFVKDVKDLADTIRQAFKIAKSGRPAPVLVDVPKDVQIAMWEYSPEKAAEKDEPLCADENLIKQASEILNSAEKPFVYFGGGLVSSQAQGEMLEIAEKIDSPIGCSLMGLSAIPTDTPRFLGMQGMHGNYACSISMHNADVILALGVRFNDRVTGNRSKFAKGAKIIHIDIDSKELNKTVTPAISLNGDVKLTLKKLLPLLNKQKHDSWTATVENFKADQIAFSDNRPELTPRNVILTLNKYLGENTPVCTDVGQHQMWTAQNIHLKKSRRFATSGGLGTMGYGLGSAIGSALGARERSVLITGDGSFGMNLNEIATAVKYNIPMVVIIMNNGVLGMVRQWQTLFYDKHYSNSTLKRQTDFAAFAKAFGADGVKVETLEELDNSLKKAFSEESVFIIDCEIFEDEFVLPMLPPGGSMDDIITTLTLE